MGQRIEESGKILVNQYLLIVNKLFILHNNHINEFSIEFESFYNALNKNKMFSFDYLYHNFLKK